MSKNKSFSEPHSSEITPEKLYLKRRDFMKATSLGAISALLVACGIEPGVSAQPPTSTDTSTVALKDELGDASTSFEDITQYNNYYEFSFEKEPVAELAKKYKPSPWKIEVSGLVEKPTTFGMEDILKKFPPEERIYRMRCVEAWSMVIPWTGFPLAKLLKEVQPTGNAKFVKFTSALLPDQMPEVKSPFYPWPYTEGLRLDEAMNDLTMLATGLYGKPMPNQNGAPIRLVVPWKYGFKYAKALVKIELVADQPRTFWSDLAPSEYGFYSNVNPDVSHPRWSQATERRIGESKRRKTLLFNGYAEQVSQLYAGMDLKKYY